LQDDLAAPQLDLSKNRALVEVPELGQQRDMGGLQNADLLQHAIDDLVDADAVVGRLRGAGLNIVNRDPVWPPGLEENAVMPLQHVGLAALYGAAWHEDPAQIDPDLGAQIQSGFDYTGVEIANAWRASVSLILLRFRSELVALVVSWRRRFWCETGAVNARALRSAGIGIGQ
jgi:hypothetical protein